MIKKINGKVIYKVSNTAYARSHYPQLIGNEHTADTIPPEVMHVQPVTIK